MPRPLSKSATVPSRNGQVAETGARRSGGAGERILTTATTLFARCGYNGVSTRDVAAAAGVNEVTVYRHYPRKHDLYLAVLESELRQIRFRGDLLSRIAEARDAQGALSCSFNLLWQTLMHRPEILRLLQFSALELNETFDPLVRKHLGELVELVARYLEPWVRSGELRCNSAKSLILTLVGIVISHNSLHRVFQGAEPGPEQIFEAYASLALLHAGGRGDVPALMCTPLADETVHGMNAC